MKKTLLSIAAAALISLGTIGAASAAPNAGLDITANSGASIQKVGYRHYRHYRRGYRRGYRRCYRYYVRYNYWRHGHHYHGVRRVYRCYRYGYRYYRYYR